MADTDTTSQPPTPWAERWPGAIGEPSRADGQILLAEYDLAWPALYEREAARIRSLLGDRVMLLEHAGSTSVPGLAAKPIIDIELAVADSADEPAYVPDLEAGGYVLRGREPGWFEHRLLKGTDPAVNLHVFTEGSPEIDRTLAFRDRLRADEGDRRLYEATKRELAARDWVYVQDYADAKTEIVAVILARAMAERATADG
jgi:GrpB-like predicted nucleotidyltransferase (UPF0157 family)